MPGIQKGNAEEIRNSAYALLQDAGGEPGKLAEPFHTIVVADTALAIIANGGVEYFFEADFPGQPDYALFSGAFRELGLLGLAGALENLVGMFPFDNPQAHQSKRIAFMSRRPEAFIDACSRFDEMAWVIDIDAVVGQYASR